MFSVPSMTQQRRAHETLCQRAFAYHDLNVFRSSAAQQLQIDGVADAVWPEVSYHVPHTSQRLRVPRRDDVTDHKPSARRGPVRVDIHNQDPMLAFRRLRPVGSALRQWWAMPQKGTDLRRSSGKVISTDKAALLWMYCKSTT
jgi:hypothetical protein